MIDPVYYEEFGEDPFDAIDKEAAAVAETMGDSLKQHEGVTLSYRQTLAIAGMLNYLAHMAAVA